MYVIKITKDKLSTMAENVEKGLRYMGKAMQCIDELFGEEEGFGERGGYGERMGGYGHRAGYGRRGGMNYRYPVEDMDMPEEEEEMMGHRRGRAANGRFTSM